MVLIFCNFGEGGAMGWSKIEKIIGVIYRIISMCKALPIYDPLHSQPILQDKSQAHSVDVEMAVPLVDSYLLFCLLYTPCFCELLLSSPCCPGGFLITFPTFLAQE